jgi:chromate transporter
MTVGIFLPAFAFTLLGHDALERFVHQPRIRVFLEGVTAGVVGLIAGTTLVLLRTSVTSVETAIVFALALGVLFKWKGRLLVPLVICAAGFWGVVSTLLDH